MRFRLPDIGTRRHPRNGEHLGFPETKPRRPFDAPAGSCFSGKVVSQSLGRGAVGKFKFEISKLKRRMERAIKIRITIMISPHLLMEAH